MILEKTLYPRVLYAKSVETRGEDVNDESRLGCGRRLIQVKRNSRELNHNTLTTLTKVLTLERKKEFRTYIYPLPQTISSSFVL